MKSKKLARATSPGHLEPATRRWFAAVEAEFQLEEHHLRLLRLAAESWDRGQQARRAIQRLGLTYQDRFGQPRQRPEIQIEAASRLGFMRALRELDLDIAPPDAARPPAIRSNRR